MAKIKSNKDLKKSSTNFKKQIVDLLSQIKTIIFIYLNNYFIVNFYISQYI